MESSELPTAIGFVEELAFGFYALYRDGRCCAIQNPTSGRQSATQKGRRMSDDELSIDEGFHNPDKQLNRDLSPDAILMKEGQGPPSNEYMPRRHNDPSYQRARGWPNGAVEEAEAGDVDVDAQLYLAGKAFRSSREDVVIRWFTMAGNQGNEEAMFSLSNIYAGLDSVQACFWMKKFFQRETQVGGRVLVRTMKFYGLILMGAPIHRTNIAVPPLPKEMIDVEEGLRTLERAGEFGGMEIISYLALLFSGSEHPNVELNFEKMVYWTKKGALMGNGQHAAELSHIYYCGVDPVNVVLGEKWLEVAVKLGHEGAREWMEWMAQDALFSAAPISSDKICKLLDDEHEENMFELYTLVDKSTKCSNPDCNNEDGARRRSRRFAVCKRCKQVKYCSQECQVAHFYAGHKTDCKHLRRQKDELKRSSRNRLLALVECFNPDCDRRQEGDQKVSHCAKCKNAKYCSRSCQLLHWKTGHRDACQRIVNELEEVNSLLEQLNSS